jgi:hypothetical protein
MRPRFLRPEPPPDDSRLRQLEIIAALPISVMWATGALFGMKHAFFGFELFIPLGGVGIVAGWMALATRDPAELPRTLRLAVAAGLAVGVAVAVVDRPEPAQQPFSLAGHPRLRSRVGDPPLLPVHSRAAAGDEGGMIRPARLTRLATASALAAAGWLTAACTGTGILDEGSSTLASLPPTETMHVQVVVHGSWGDSAFELDFHRDEAGHATVKGVRLTGKWNDVSESFGVSRRGVPAEAPISGADLIALDRALDYYRGDPDEGCEDTRFITLTRMRRNKTVGTETLVDRACGEGLKGLDFSDVMDRLGAPRVGDGAR